MIIDNLFSSVNLKIGLENLLNTSSYKEKFVILQAIGIIELKSKETRVVAYTCRYSSGPLIPNSATAID